MKRQVLLLTCAACAALAVRGAEWAGETADWMKFVPDGTPLARIMMPGAHDAAMVEGYERQITIVPKILKGLFLNQDLTIGQQLAAGVRCFDLRPYVTSDGTVYSCHCTYVDELKLLVGGAGEGFRQIFGEAQAFLAANPSETVIFDFSKWSYDGNAATDTKTRAAVKALMEEFGAIFYVRSADGCPSVNALPLGDVRGKVIAVWDETEPDVENGIWGKGGFPARAGCLATSGGWSNTLDLDYLKENQRQKWDAVRGEDPTEHAFLLAWQLTWQFDLLDIADSNRKLAAKANPLLKDFLAEGVAANGKAMIVNADYVSADLSRQIIAYNFEGGADPGTTCYHGLRKLAPYLHEIWYDDYVFDRNGETLSQDPKPACSSVRNGNFIGRNLDFYLDDTPEFIVHVAADQKKGRLASVGVAMHAGLREEGVAGGRYSRSYELVPNRTLDGINERGVAINQNVVAFNYSVVTGVEGGEFTGTNPSGEDLNISFVTRFVLDHATSAAHAVELLKARNLVGLSVSGDLLHYMISDAKETYIVEIVHNALVARRLDRTVMTNFNLNWDNGNGRALEDGVSGWTIADYPSPADVVRDVGTGKSEAELSKFYAPHAEGVERFVRLRDNYDEGATFTGMRSLLRRVQYSQASTFATQPYWYSDRCSVTTDAIIEYYLKLGYESTICNIYAYYGPYLYGYIDWALEEYLMKDERTYLADKDRYRKSDTGVWLTVHNSTYDIERRMFAISVQEDYTRTFGVYLDPAKETSVMVTLPDPVGGRYEVVDLSASAGIDPIDGVTYELPLGAKIEIFVVPDASHAVVEGTNPLIIEKVTAETSVTADMLPQFVKTSENFRLYPNGDGHAFVPATKSSEQFLGTIIGESGVEGTIDLKMTKPNKKTGLFTLTATVKTLVDKASYSFKAKDVSSFVNGSLTVPLEGTNAKSKEHTLKVTLDGDSLTGLFDDCVIDGAKQAFAISKHVKRDAILPYVGTWTGAFEADAGLCSFSAKLTKTGAATVKVLMTDGKSLSCSAKAEVGAGGIVAVPVTVSRNAKGVMESFGFRLVFATLPDGTKVCDAADVSPVRGWTKKTGAVAIIAETEFDAAALLTMTSKEFKTLEVTVDPALTEQLGSITKNGLKFAASTGLISGSLKWGKVSGKASGVVIGEVGFGTISVKIDGEAAEYEFMVVKNF